MCLLTKALNPFLNPLFRGFNLFSLIFSLTSHSLFNLFIKFLFF
ncbi:putative membrane protein [Helicobacter pylori Hp P-16]|nr:putative membrane protein [Helicobacter pylori Hp P-16]